MSNNKQQQITNDKQSQTTHDKRQRTDNDKRQTTTTTDILLTCFMVAYFLFGMVLNSPQNMNNFP